MFSLHIMVAGKIFKILFISEMFWVETSFLIPFINGVRLWRDVFPWGNVPNFAHAHMWQTNGMNTLIPNDEEEEEEEEEEVGVLEKWWADKMARILEETE